MEQPGDENGGQKDGETNAGEQPEKGIPLSEYLARQLEKHPRYNDLAQMVERNFAPIRNFVEQIGLAAAKMTAAYNRAQTLSDLLHSDSGLSALRDELRREPIDNAMTLSLLLQLERGRGESVPERKLPKRRTDPMDALVLSAQKEVADPFDVHAVWPILVRYAKSPNPPPPMCGYVPAEGIQWDDGKEELKYMKKQAVYQRLRRLKQIAELAGDGTASDAKER